jgi:hypothetical protein
VTQALQVGDGKLVTVIGIIQHEHNDQFGLRLAESVTADQFLAVQLSANQRPAFSPLLKPEVRGKKVKVTGKRGKYTGIRGLREITSIELVSDN